MRALFGNLKPDHWSGPGGGTANTPPGWSITGDAPTAVNTQSIVDAELVADEGYIDAYVWSMYPPASVADGTVSVINRGLEAHMASAHRRRVKVSAYLQLFWFLADDGNGLTSTGSKLTAYATWLRDQILAAGDDWLKVRGKPVLYLYDPDTWAADMTTTNAIKAVLAPLQPYYMGAGSTSFASGNLTTIGVSGTVQYGPNGITLSPAGQHPQSDVMALDAARWQSAGGRDLTTGTTPARDARARKGDPRGLTNGYADPPSMPDRMRHIRNAYALNPRLHTEYAYDEITEGGTGVHVGSQWTGRYIRDSGLYGRILGSARIPTAYSYPIGCHSLYWAKAGTWTWTRDSSLVIDGTFDSDEMRSTVAASTLTLTHESATRFVVRGTKAPTYGHLEVRLDTVLVATVDCSAGVSTVNSVLWDSGALSEGSHTVELRAVGDGTVACGYGTITWNPRALLT